AIFDRTVSYSKLVDRTSARQLAGIVYHGNPDVDAHTVKGGRRRRVRDAVAALALVGVLRYEGARRGANAGLVICVPAREDEGDVPPMEHVLAGKHVSKAERAPDAPPTCSPGNTQRAPGARQHLETTEEVSEEGEHDPVDALFGALKENSGKPPAQSECSAVIARGRAKGLDDERLLELVAEGHAEGDAYPSDARHRVDEAAAK